MPRSAAVAAAAPGPSGNSSAASTRPSTNAAALNSSGMMKRRASTAAMPIVMTNHAAYPHTPGNNMPASASHFWITTVLHNRIGYKGIILSDDLEMGGILRRQERTLVMIEPPGDAWRGGILKVDDGILVPGEVGFVEQRPRAMHQPLILKLRVLANALPIEAREQRRGAGAIETFVVIKNLDPHRPLSQRQSCSCRSS